MHWIGTVGIGICSGGSEIYDRPALTLMLGDFPQAASGYCVDLKGI